MVRIRASGATPAYPLAASGAPAMSPATRVPWPSQSSSPRVSTPVSMRSPPGTSRSPNAGPGRTPVSMTATVTPAPRDSGHSDV